MKNEKIFELLENSENFPKLTQDVSRIFDILKNPEGLHIDGLVQEVTRYDQLSELILGVYSAKQFNRGMATIKDAVIYLGIDAVQNLLVFFLSKQLFSEITTTNKKRKFKMAHYWRHVLGTSAAGYILSLRIKKLDKHKLFTYGLIHDIGIPLLDICVPDLVDEIFEKLLKGMHQLVAERSVLGGFTHAEIGAWLCRKWNIRDDIIDIVEFHHTPFIAKSDSDEVKLMYVADVLSTEYYEKLLGLNINHAINGKIMDYFGLTDIDRLAVTDALPGEVDRLGNFFTWL
ncbi:MAG: HDOD domain-containing protein [Clostridiaceae bacterium]|jgi:HD-like signal output (HDOD) protein|nr:HDOD domain-containing protein [Clostridiaceae bacterium]